MSSRVKVLDINLLCRSPPHWFYKALHYIFLDQGFLTMVLQNMSSQLWSFRAGALAFFCLLEYGFLSVLQEQGFSTTVILSRRYLCGLLKHGLSTPELRRIFQFSLLGFHIHDPPQQVSQFLGKYILYCTVQSFREGVLDLDS